MKIKKIGVMSLAKIQAVFNGIFGLILGAFMTLMSLVVPAKEGAPPALFGVAAIVFMPIFYAILGFLIGLLMAFIYNLVAQRLGGIELEVE